MVERGQAVGGRDGGKPVFRESGEASGLCDWQLLAMVAWATSL